MGIIKETWKLMFKLHTPSWKVSGNVFFGHNNVDTYGKNYARLH